MISDQRLGEYRGFDEHDIKVLPSTLTAAKREESKYYYTGKPCKHGHLSVRYTKSRGCASCQEYYHLHGCSPSKGKKHSKVSVFGIST